MPRDLPVRTYFLAWVPLGASLAALEIAHGGFARPVASVVVAVLVLAVLGFPVLSLPRRVPWHGGRRRGFFAAQLMLAAVYGITATAVLFWVRRMTSFVTGPATSFDLVMAAGQALFAGILYVAIAGLAYAWENDQRAREEAAHASEADALRAHAELAALRSQLNPHFLLNTLHAALGLVRRDPALAERALERLGEVLHFGLRMHRESLDQVLFADEWAFVRSYLEIESLRLEDRLRLHLEAGPEVMNTLVPPFVLQPLVENAILHAIAPRRAGGVVAITAARRGKRLHLEVRDDGPGMSLGLPSQGTGLGLRLLRERLALLYSGDASLSVKPADGGGTRATIDLPFVAAAAMRAEAA